MTPAPGRPVRTASAPAFECALVAENATFLWRCDDDLEFRGVEKRHGAVGVVNGIDIAAREGGFVMEAPMVIGHEAAGTVIEVGSSVTSLEVGTRVCMGPVCRTPAPAPPSPTPTTSTPRSPSGRPRPCLAC